MRDLPEVLRDEGIWTAKPHSHGQRFARAKRAFVPDAPWLGPLYRTLHGLLGLRGGGATDFYLIERDPAALRRRGRGAQLATVDRYVQEAVAATAEIHFTQEQREVVLELAHLVASIVQERRTPTPIWLSTF